MSRLPPGWPHLALCVPSITPMRMWQACFARVSFSAFVMMVLPYEPQRLHRNVCAAGCCAPIRYFSSIYYLFYVKTSRFFRQNVHQLAKIRSIASVFVKIARLPSILTAFAASAIIFTIPARSRAPGRSPASFFHCRLLNGHHEGVCLWRGMPGQAPFLSAQRRNHS